MRSGSNINTILREIATLPPEDQVYVSESPGQKNSGHEKGSIGIPC